MTRDSPDISRRKLLGAMGTIGGAAALGGASTMAFFSDEEEFANNQLVAGELDLKVDWEEHYSDWSDDEIEGLEFEPVMDLSEIPTSNPDGLVPDPTDPDNWMAFPPGFGDLLYVWLGDVGQFMDNTAIDAHPDSDGDGIQDTIKRRQQIRTDNPGYPEDEIERLFREQFADVPDELEGRRPLIDLADVKPGDFGEVTFSLHLFDNPGYLWLNGGLVDASEGDLTEPERKDPDELDGVVELLDEVQVALWHDDGNNVFTDPEYVVHRKPADGPDSDENITLSREEAQIARGTLRDLLYELSRPNGIPLDADPRSDDRDCFPNSTTRFLGFAWWLPVDHANEIQTDSVTFDLGLYTEQCRHNDGSGLDAGGDVLDATVGSGDYSQTSYDRKLGMALRYGNSHYEDGSIGRAPYEQELHPSTNGYGQNFAYESGTTYTFRAELDPGTETELAVFGDGLGRSVADSNLATGSYGKDATGGPTEGELALTVKAQSGSLSDGDSVTIQNVQVNGVPVTPESLTATKGGTELAYMALTGLDFTTDVAVTGELTFDVDESKLPADDPHDVMTAVGIDWR